MYDISVNSNFGLDVGFKTKKKCELFVDVIPIEKKDSINIMWVMEPNEISGLRESIISNQDKFDLILTWDKEIINYCYNSKLFPYGTTWIKDFEFLSQKEYCITTLVGGKSMSHGHFDRQKLPNICKSITSIPVHIYNSINTSYSGNEELRKMKSNLWKNELFYSQFHIVVENVYSDNWFTEKIIDCFQTKTIPIYLGCDNIGDYFDLRGIFRVKTIDEIVDVCNSITLKTYEKMEEFVNINYEKSMMYSDFRKRIELEINMFIDNN